MNDGAKVSSGIKLCTDINIMAISSLGVYGVLLTVGQLTLIRFPWTSEKLPLIVPPKDSRLSTNVFYIKEVTKKCSS
ncbi:hypothetical protein RhiirA4_485163 [Rhizophagus irregularis]|uniref:Uncharacterized protein n=1 Tax=Rhizophagus irregularis TaxID=588596 RepID=A0A2I1HPV6_9GLOM|nr:hypothetical protein RhiirA4_485163 [Rhizophagus irregularis]